MSGWAAALELLLVFGSVIGIAVWELWRLRRERRRDAARNADSASKQ